MLGDEARPSGRAFETLYAQIRNVALSLAPVAYTTSRESSTDDLKTVVIRNVVYQAVYAAYHVALRCIRPQVRPGLCSWTLWTMLWTRLQNRRDTDVNLI